MALEKRCRMNSSWIVGSITGFRNSYFYVTLASMLLEPLLPTTSIMNTEHGEGLRKILLDSIVLAEYSFLRPECMDQIPKKHAKRVNLTRLMVANEAVNLMREHGEHTKAASYLNAFVMSSLPSQLLKWIRSDFGNELSANEPTGSSPRAYLRWMLNIENRGIKIFDDDMSTYHAKLMSHDDVKEETEQLAIREEGKNLNSDLFYIDNKGEQKYGIGEDEDTSKSMSAAFMAAAHSIESSENGGRKRKAKKGEKMKKVKFVKYNLVENYSLSGEQSAVPRNEDSNSRSEIENPYSSGDD